MINLQTMTDPSASFPLLGTQSIVVFAVPFPLPLGRKIAPFEQ